MKRGFLVMAVLTVLAVGFAFFDVKWGEKKESEKAKTSLMSALDKATVDRVELRKDDQHIVLEKAQGEWKLTSPVVDAANESEVVEFVEGVITERYQSVIAEWESSESQDKQTEKLKTFGLEDPQERILLRGNGHTEEFRIGKIRNFQGEPYLQKWVDGKPESKVVLGQSSWNPKVTKTVLEFRDRRWMRASKADVEKIEVRNSSGNVTLSLSKKDGSWAYTEKNWDLDRELMIPFLEMLNNSVIQSYKLEDLKNLTKADWNPGRKPEMRIYVGLKDGKGWNVDAHFLVQNKPQASKSDKVAPPQSLVIFVQKEIGKAFEVLYDDAVKWKNASDEGLRDRKKPFKFDRVAVKEIQVDLKGDAAQLAGLKKDSVLKLKQLVPGKWELVDPPAELSFDPTAVDGFLTRLSELRVNVFEAAKTIKSQIDIHLLAENGSSVFRINVGDKKPIEGKNNVQVAVNEKENFLIDEKSLQNLNWISLFKKNEEKPENKTKPTDTKGALESIPQLNLKGKENSGEGR